MKMLRILFLVMAGALLGCKNDATEHTTHVHTEAEAVKYTCPMHPNVVSDQPGKCPVCGMDLVRVGQGGGEGLMLTETQIKLANITAARITSRPVGNTVGVTGTLALDQSRATAVSSRVAGRIEKLYLEESGLMVKKGQPLYELFSEQLQALQNEYILAVRQYNELGARESRYKNFMEATAKKLRLYGLTDNQLKKLANAQSVPYTTTFYSPETSYVESVKTVEGRYVAEGEILFNLQNLENLWVEAELYPSETTMIKVGDKIGVRLSDGRTETAAVTFLSPELRNRTQISIMRASIANKEMTLRPGMPVKVFFTSSSKVALTVPTDAVIRDSKGTHLFVQDGRNNFVARKVETGVENFTSVEIKSGVEEGDTVVVSGAYLLYSEMVLKHGVNFSSHQH